MVLSTHAVIGAAVITLVPTHPIIGGLLAFGSHFAFDAVPHWDYKLRQNYSAIHKTEATHEFKLGFIVDLLKTAFDALLGLTLAILFFFSFAPIWVIAVGAIMAILPDLLHLIDSRIYIYPIRVIQKFHHWIHTTHKISSFPLGPFLQIIMVFLIVILRLKI